uniref:Uncharacterized protein n=1 Tax=Anguilla anguilla TaxID=7936 RepID=A0A0E9PY87_ANGAN
MKPRCRKKCLDMFGECLSCPGESTEQLPLVEQRKC